MKNYPDDFSVRTVSDRVILTWTDADGQTMTANLTGPEGEALSHDLRRKSADAIREAQRLRDLADDQLRAVTGIRVGGRGRRVA